METMKRSFMSLLLATAALSTLAPAPYSPQRRYFLPGPPPSPMDDERIAKAKEKRLRKAAKKARP